MASHYRVFYAVSFPDRESAEKFIEERGWHRKFYEVLPCYCDNLNRAERLAWRWPRLFKWLLQREDPELVGLPENPLDVPPLEGQALGKGWHLRNKITR